MNMGLLLFSVLGLCLFEVVSSLDNAVVNADVLATMSQKWRKWFLVWGLFFSVFLVRGLLPWLILWMSCPSLGAWGALTATMSSDLQVKSALEAAAPNLLLAGGLFLVFLFLHWLFWEPKNFGLAMERFFDRRKSWFAVVVAGVILAVVGLALMKDYRLACAALVGLIVFFIVGGLKAYAMRAEGDLKQKKDLTEISKLIYLEILDATFSVDGVIGAFAFTMSVPLIILGNGLGAMVVRQLTIQGVEKIKQYPYLKNGAMYSIFFLGLLMSLEGFGVHVPPYWAPAVTVGVIWIFYAKSLAVMKQ